nr:reverse transcriptase domain-containing protein [Tanacetum cinerariifolium]
MSYKKPPIPPPVVDQQEPIEVTTDTELPSPEDIQPPLVQVEVQVDKTAEEPSVVIPKAKANLSYPSRLQKEKLREKDDILAAKFMEIFRDLHFELSFANALVHMPKSAPMFKKLLNNKDKLIELTKTPLNKNCSAVVLKKLPEKPADFVVLDFVADPRVPLILGRPFLSTAHAIINVFEREIIIRQNQQSLTIQCRDIPSVKKVEQINKIDFINARGIDFESEEIDDFLNDDSIPFRVEDSSFNMDEDILFLESLLKEDPIPPHPIIPNQTKLPIEETNHSLNMVYEHFNTNLVTKDVVESSTKNLILITNECMVVSEMEASLEEIDVVSITNDVLPPSDDDSDEEVDVVGNLRVDNFIQNYEHEYSESEDSDFDNLLLPLPPPKPPDKEFDFEIDVEIDFEKEILVVRNAIVKFDARVKFDILMMKMMYYRISCLLSLLRSFLYSPPRVRTRSLILDYPPEIEVFLCWNFCLDYPPEIEVFLCWNFCPVSKIFISFY